MSPFARVLGLGLLAALGTSGVANAQYYAPPPPPPGYYPPPGPPGYYPPPPRQYYRSSGYRCDATFRTPGGPREHMVCEMREPRPLGSGCECAPPPPPPGYSSGPYLHGRTVE